METVKQTFDLRPYTKKDMRVMYGVSKHVFNNLLKPFEDELGEIVGKFLNCRQVELIIAKIGIPKKVQIE
jgi:hypothetical protein